MRKVSVKKIAVINKCEAVDVSFVPPLVRRRLSPIQKVYFALANLAEEEAASSVVFASSDGEVSLTRRLQEEFELDGAVSPHKFSASVYNAAPGLWSVFTKNNAKYTAVVARDDSIEVGLLEALTSEFPSLLVYAEEDEGGYGVSVYFSSREGVEIKYSFDASIDAAPISFHAFVDFLEGRINVLQGRYMRFEHSIKG